MTHPDKPELKECEYVTPEQILECFENCDGDLDFGIFKARRLLEQCADRPQATTAGEVEKVTDKQMRLLIEETDGHALSYKIVDLLKKYPHGLIITANKEE